MRPLTTQNTSDDRAAQHPLRTLGLEALVVIAGIALYQAGYLNRWLTLVLVIAVPALTFKVWRANPQMNQLLRAAYVAVTGVSVILGIFFFTQYGKADDQPGYQTSTDFVEDQLGAPIDEPSDETVVNDDPPPIEEVPVEEPPSENSLQVRLAAWASYVESNYGLYGPTPPSVDLSNDDVLMYVNGLLIEQPTANGVVEDTSGMFYPGGGEFEYVRIMPGGQWLPETTKTDRFYQGFVEGWDGSRSLQEIHFQWVDIEDVPADATVRGTFVIVED